MQNRYVSPRRTTRRERRSINIHGVLQCSGFTIIMALCLVAPGLVEVMALGKAFAIMISVALFAGLLILCGQD